MEETLTLNDGTQIQGHKLETESRLFLYLNGTTLAEAFNLLIDPKKTEYIQWERYGQTGNVYGFTKLISISEEAGGMICAALKKE